MIHRQFGQLHIPEVWAVDSGAEFNPATEAHHHLLTIYAVDPGCTMEFQLVGRDGHVTRLTTTDDEASDVAALLRAIHAELRRQSACLGLGLDFPAQ